MTAPVITLIAALDSHLAIGRGNTLPWSIPADLKRFKALTRNKPIIMGRKTAESLGRSLPFRKNIVLSRHGMLPFADMHSAQTVEQALALAESAEEVMVVGGGEIYALFLPFATRLRLTWVDTVIEDADAFFPPFNPQDWREMERDFHPPSENQNLAYTFVDYLRRDD